MKQKIEFRYIAAPLISIMAFLLLLGGASYAYYTQSVGGIGNPSNIANANLAVPRGCSFLSSATNCVITGNEGTTINFNDSSISRAEMAMAYKNNKVAQATCSLNIGVQGSENCACFYSVIFDKRLDVGTNYTQYTYTGSSLRASINSTNTSHSISNKTTSTIGAIVASNILKVTTGGTAVYENFNISLNAYNSNSSQDNIAGLTFVYYLRAIPVCSVSTVTPSVVYRQYSSNTSALNIGDSIVGVNNITTTIPTTDKYLKYETIDDKITAEYVCLKLDNNEYCLKYGDFGTYSGMSTYTVTSISNPTGNFQVLQNAQQHSFSCRYENTYAECTYGNYLLSSNLNGNVNVRYSGWGEEKCLVEANGKSYCSYLE